jgi:hypothetical protein
MLTTKQVRHLMSQPVKTLGRNDKLSLAHSVMCADRIRSNSRLNSGRLTRAVAATFASS